MAHSSPNPDMLHDQAEAVLRRLYANRALIESRLQVGGRDDCVRRVTGKSAIDDAIEHTRTMLSTLGARDGSARRHEPCDILIDVNGYSTPVGVS